MNFVLVLAILTAPLAADEPQGTTVEVFRCNFDEAADQNFDAWPDGWARRRASGYPLFLPIRIVSVAADANTADTASTPSRALRLTLDGGAAAIYSPRVPISPLFSYRLTGELRTQGLAADVAYYSLTFFDADGRVLETHQSPALTRQDNWAPATIGPILPASTDAYTVAIGLHLHPREPLLQDLEGHAEFRSIGLERLPRVQLAANQPTHFFTSPENIEVTCDVSGVLTPDPLVTFTLEDIQGRALATEQVTLSPKKLVTDHTLLPAVRDARRAGVEQPLAAGATDLATPQAPETVRGFAGEAKWKLPLTDYGFYRVRAVLADGGAATVQRRISLAVARPLQAADDGEFGWSLPQADTTLSLNQLVPLLGDVGLHWLKFPMWFAHDDLERSERLAWFTERISAHGINLIGVLDQPPPTVRQTLGAADKLPIATVFAEAPLWKPAVDPVMMRLTLKVQWWQLGGDDDLSFVGYPQLQDKIQEIKQHFLRYGQEVQVGLPWPWLIEPPTAETWDFLTRTAAPSLTARESAAYLAQPAAKGPQRWMTLEPLSRRAYDLETRTRDLIERMLASKINQAQAVFVPDPFSAEHGLLQADGTPDELLLPWRTTALVLGGARYLGSIHLPSGSTNHLFQRKQDVVLVVWNTQPCVETLYLGDQIEHFDAWGQTLTYEQQQAEGGATQSIHVSRTPTFVTGLSLPVTAWRVSLAFEQTHLPSVFGREQTVSYQFRNPFEQGVGGEVRIVGPDDWEIGTLPMGFKVAGQEKSRGRFNVRFKADTQTGPQTVRFDFKVTADRNYAFSVFHPLQVGTDEIAIETRSRLGEAGELIVEQTFENRSDNPVSFNCLLFAPGRRRERNQVIELGHGRHVSHFVLPNGEELLGQTLLLRAEEIAGDRILNYRIVPTR